MFKPFSHRLILAAALACTTSFAHAGFTTQEDSNERAWNHGESFAHDSAWGRASMQMFDADLQRASVVALQAQAAVLEWSSDAGNRLSPLAVSTFRCNLWNLLSGRSIGAGNGNVTGLFAFLAIKFTTIQVVEQPPAAVPLPAAAWLFAIGLIGLGGAQRRRNRVSSTASVATA